MKTCPFKDSECNSTCELFIEKFDGCAFVLLVKKLETLIIKIEQF